VRCAHFDKKKTNGAYMHIGQCISSTNLIWWF